MIHAFDPSRPLVRALAALLLIALAAPTLHSSDVHHVPADFNVLQDAIDAAAPGDTIVIDGGEHLYTRIDKPLTLVGRASNIPFLTVIGSGMPGPNPAPQEPAMTVDNPGGLVSFVGLKIGGVTNATGSSTNNLGFVATGSGGVRLFHTTVRALAWIQGAEFVPGYTAMFVGNGMQSFLAADSRVIGASNLATSNLYCYQSLASGPAGLEVYVQQPVTLLDTQVSGGGSYQGAGYAPQCSSSTSFQPASCDELTGGFGGTGLIAGGTVWVANTKLTGGRGATMNWQGPTPLPGFPCSKPDGPPHNVGELVDLGVGARLGGSGALVEQRLWTLEWDVAANSVLLVGPALLEPVLRGSGTPQFVDPDQARMKPLEGPGPGSITLMIPPLSDEMIGQVMAFQIFTPGVGLSRPVMAALQPE